MFDDDITSALLNGINNGSTMPPPNTSTIQSNQSFITLTPRDALEYSITATGGDQSALSFGANNGLNQH